MRLLELQIENVRGITSLTLKPNGQNLVIWGPNGAGKSAVIDAVDFLLTGEITRLTGKGTAGISLGGHGPHVGHTPDEAIVRAVVQFPGVATPITIERCMSNPKVLKHDPAAKLHLAPILAVADQGQHVLTRREILRYVTAEAGTRAQQIQALLNLSDVEDIRKALVKTENDLDKEVTNTQAAVRTAQAAVKATTQLENYDEAGVLARVNHCRSVLGGAPVADLAANKLQDGLVPPDVQVKPPAVNLALLEKDRENVIKCLTASARAAVAADDRTTRDLLAEVRRDPALLRALNQEDLIQQGVKMLDGSGQCPLCDTVWDPPSELRDHLQAKSDRAHTARVCRERIEAVAERVAEACRVLMSSLQKFSEAAQIVGQQEDHELLMDWLKRLKSLMSALSSPVDQYPHPSFSSEDVMGLLAPASVEKVLDRVVSAATALLPKATPERTAWDTLTRLEENLKALDRAQERHRQAELAKTRAGLAMRSFQSARDKVLGNLYDGIRDRFVLLYRKLHGADEENFTAKLEPDGPSLKLEVDFHGHGSHPPHALHSEGHQDSMGLCLYLALSERLTNGVLDLVLLDDVVMSVDADHRRQLCAVLASEFPGHQFLITTHDRQWAAQLRTEGVVHAGGSIEFSQWNIETGPRVTGEADLFGKIRGDLAKGDVPGAAHKLRRGAEEFFAEICDVLNARVPFKLTARWELGELMPAGFGRYRDMLGKAKKAAQSWKNESAMERLKELDSVATQVYKRTQAEQWAINANVHYNAWVDFNATDFGPVVDAFEDLFELFYCGDCKQRLNLLTEGPKEKALMCSCGHVSWSLQEKPKS